MVYAPLELAQTSIPTGPDLPAPLIHGFDREGTSAPEDVSESFASGWASASGLIISTPLDLNRFIRGYVGGKLFGPGVRKQQRAFITGAGSGHPALEPMPAGWHSSDTRQAAAVMYGHGGNTIGFTQYAAASSDGSRSMTISINLQRTHQSEGQAVAAFRKAASPADCAALAG